MDSCHESDDIEEESEVKIHNSMSVEKEILDNHGYVVYLRDPYGNSIIFEKGWIEAYPTFEKKPMVVQSLLLCIEAFREHHGQEVPMH